LVPSLHLRDERTNGRTRDACLCPLCLSGASILRREGNEPRCVTGI